MSPLPPSVVHVVAGLGPEGGGISYSVPTLAAALARKGARTCLRSVGAPAGRDAAGAPWHRHAPAAGPLGRLLRSSPDLLRALAEDARAGAVLHANGLWLMPNVYPGRIRRRLGGRPAPLVHSTRGMLGPAALAISAWKKRPFWWLAQRSALAAADCLHATAASEYEEIRAAGLMNPVAVIPNGIDLPDLSAAPRHQGGGRTLLSLGRIHPKKGLDRLLRAWARIEPAHPSWRVRIVGPAEVGHNRELEALSRSLGLERVSIEGPVYGAADKLAVYRAADLFVLPTLNENFALTVAEALAAEVPVISTRGAPWAGLQAHGCGWWIDHGVEPMAAALGAAMALAPEERHAMGERGRAWMARDFAWDAIAEQMAEVYRWLAVGGERPRWVRLD